MLNSIAEKCGWFSPKVYNFSSVIETKAFVANLRKLEEGVVLYKPCGTPLMKVKNPAYICAHGLRENGVLSEKRVLDLIIMRETDEYLAIFPEDEKTFDPYLQASLVMCDELECMEELVRNFEGTQKDFAMRVKGLPVAPIAFSMKSGKTIEEAWERLTQNAKRSMILAYKD